MNPPPRNLDEETRKLIDQWLELNTPTQCKTYERTDPDDVEYKNNWGKRKKS